MLTWRSTRATKVKINIRPMGMDFLVLDRRTAKKHNRISTTKAALGRNFTLESREHARVVAYFFDQRSFARSTRDPRRIQGRARGNQTRDNFVIIVGDGFDRRVAPGV